MSCWMILTRNGDQHCGYEDVKVVEKVAYQVRAHSTRRTYPKRGGLTQHCPRDTQYLGETPSQAHGKICGRSKPGLLVPCAHSVRRRERHTSTEESLNEAANSGRVDVEGTTGEKERSCETTCAELFGDGCELL